MASTYCRHCGVELRRFLGRWHHAVRLGPVACPRAEPEPEPGPDPAPGPSASGPSMPGQSGGPPADRDG